MGYWRLINKPKKSPSIGLIGGIMSMSIAPGLMCAHWYVLGVTCFILGVGIIDWNRS